MLVNAIKAIKALHEEGYIELNHEDAYLKNQKLPSTEISGNFVI